MLLWWTGGYRKGVHTWLVMALLGKGRYIHMKNQSGRNDQIRWRRPCDIFVQQA